MKKILLTLVFLAAGIVHQPGLFADSWERWNEFAVQHKLHDRVKIGIKSEQRFKDGMDLFLYNVAPGVEFSWKSWLGAGLNYKYEREEKSGGWEGEHRIELEPALKWEWKGIKFNDRNRIEYRMFEDKDNSFRYRNRIKASSSANLEKLKPLFYAYDELFYDFSVNEFNQNRLAFGITHRILRFLDGDIYYLCKSKKSGCSWESTNVFGTKFNFSF